jgi:hypothetical protein
MEKDMNVFGGDYKDETYVDGLINVMTDYCIANNTTSVPASVIAKQLATRGLSVDSKEFRRLLLNGTVAVLEIHYTLVDAENKIKMRKQIVSEK